MQIVFNDCSPVTMEHLEQSGISICLDPSRLISREELNARRQAAMSKGMEVLQSSLDVFNHECLSTGSVSDALNYLASKVLLDDTSKIKTHSTSCLLWLITRQGKQLKDLRSILPDDCPYIPDSLEDLLEVPRTDMDKMQLLSIYIGLHLRGETSYYIQINGIKYGRKLLDKDFFPLAFLLSTDYDLTLPDELKETISFIRQVDKDLELLTP